MAARNDRQTRAVGCYHMLLIAVNDTINHCKLHTYSAVYRNLQTNKYLIHMYQQATTHICMLFVSSKCNESEHPWGTMLLMMMTASTKRYTTASS